MKIAVVALVAFLAAPAAAFGEVSMTMREVPLHGGRTLAGTAPRFDMVGLHWRGSGSVDFRTRSAAGRWSAWHRAAPEAEDVPNAGTAEARAAHGWRLGNPYWTGQSNRIAYRLHGSVTRLRAYFIESPDERVPLRRLSIANSPPIISRLAWGANEAIRRAPPQYAPTLQFALVHHTAGTNSYTRSQSAAIVRGIEVYHVQGNGWNDIGYNFLVDKYGQVFEGRFGGVDKNVVGAHAEGFNTGSVGVAMLGTYSVTPPTTAAKDALVNLLAWRLDLGHVDPLSSVTVVSGGNPRFPVGTPVFLRAVSGHRDTGFTSCPGAALYAQLGALARRAALSGLPKLYAPSVQGQLGGLVRFQARLSEPLPWVVTITDSTGAVVATGSGTGGTVDWTWDATTVAPAAYTWSVSAGDSVRPAKGTIGAAPVPLTIKSVTATPPTAGDSTQISYTLSTAATVTATLRTADGRNVSVLFTQQHPAGKQSFRFDTAGVPEGRYLVVLAATNGRTTVTATIPVLVDRTVRSLTAAPAVANGALTFSFELTRPAPVHLVVAQGGKTVADVYSATAPAGTQTVGWDAGTVKDGRYAAVLATTDQFGTATRSTLFRIDKTPPRLRALSFRALRFWVSEPARVRLVVNGRARAANVRAGVFTFSHGRVRTVRISARDVA
ncbi:MAG TPA: N-acetylmuramoyl-L-alanine amidase, partial [Gaiellaceae bacterium]|nr:N-acetylmuramoyl-L-alanine amidase [Gaiellaceae bacterium]